MRLKKGFTLAEILIVLMVIGVIATLTVPTMMKGVTEAQLKTSYKKAYNTIANFAAMERVSGALPSRATEKSIAGMYQSLNGALSVTTFAQHSLNKGVTIGATFSPCVTYDKDTIGAHDVDCKGATLTLGGADTGASGGPQEDSVTWIITEDNLAYTVLPGGSGEDKNCSTKQVIAAQDSDQEAANLSCAVVVVDVNGLSRGPNTFESQGLGNAGLDAGVNLDAITGDLYKIYLGSDGGTAGPRSATVTGRIAADLK